MAFSKEAYAYLFSPQRSLKEKIFNVKFLLIIEVLQTKVLDIKNVHVVDHFMLKISDAVNI